VRPCPDWRAPGCAAVVEVVGGKEHLLPLEFLPVFDPAGCDEPVTNRADFAARCRSYPGFGCVVRRRLLPLPVSGTDWLATGADGRVPLRFLWYDALPGAAAEHTWLTGPGSGRVRVLGPHPAAGESPVDLAERIFDPGWDGGPVPDQIQHFSAHCRTGPNVDPDDYELILHGEGQELSLGLGDLGQLLYKFGAGPPRSATDLPFVLLNACGSSVVDPQSSASFPELFLTNDNRGVLGTEVAIPDDLAAIYSQEFYRALLMGGVPVGKAAQHARTCCARTATRSAWPTSSTATPI
jgi:hypothetical protein